MSTGTGTNTSYRNNGPSVRATDDIMNGPSSILPPLLCPWLYSIVVWSGRDALLLESSLMRILNYFKMAASRFVDGRLCCRLIPAVNFYWCLEVVSDRRQYLLLEDVEARGWSIFSDMTPLGWPDIDWVENFRNWEWRGVSTTLRQFLPPLPP